MPLTAVRIIHELYVTLMVPSAKLAIMWDIRNAARDTRPPSRAGGDVREEGCLVAARYVAGMLQMFWKVGA